VGPWVHEHRGVLRIAVVVLAALVVVFLDRPTGAAILGVAFVLIVLLGVIEFLDQPREHTPPPDGPLASRGRAGDERRRLTTCTKAERHSAPPPRAVSTYGA